MIDTMLTRRPLRTVHASTTSGASPIESDSTATSSGVSRSSVTGIREGRGQSASRAGWRERSVSMPIRLLTVVNHPARLSIASAS